MAVIAILVIALSAWLVDSAVTGRAPIQSLKMIIGGGTLEDANAKKIATSNSASPSSGAMTGYVPETSTSAYTGGTYSSWFAQLLTALNIPVTSGALQGLADVVGEEGANAYNNPFNIEWHPGQSSAWQGIANFNSVGVQEYATPEAGINATAQFLTMNPRYQNLLAALRSGSRSNVQSALVQEYTWAPFRTSSQPREQSILTSQLGS